jgi:hypothetical protein
MQHSSEGVQLTPGHRGHRPFEQLLVRPGEMASVGVGRRVRREIRAVQLRGERLGPQPGMELRQPPDGAGRERAVQYRDQVQVAAALLVVAAGERAVRPDGERGERPQPREKAVE